MAIGAIIVISLSYASQMSAAEYVCNAERFDNKAGPFLVQSWRPFGVCKW